MNNLKKYKITVFGDSIPKGIMVKEHRLLKMDNAIINLIENNYDIKIENISMFGQTLQKLDKRNVFDSFINKINPEENHIALLFIGGNDSDYNWKEVGKNPKMPHNPNTPLNVFSEILENNILKLKQKCEHVILMTIPPIDSNRFYNNFIGSLTNKESVLAFLNGDIANIHRHQECYNLAIMKTAFKLNCPLIDIRTDLLASQNLLEYLCEDGIHPNEKGHLLMANSAIKYIDKELLKG